MLGNFDSKAMGCTTTTLLTLDFHRLNRWVELSDGWASEGDMAKEDTTTDEIPTRRRVVGNRNWRIMKTAQNQTDNQEFFAIVVVKVGKGTHSNIIGHTPQ
jgi:hypothetical protein